MEADSGITAFAFDGRGGGVAASEADVLASAGDPSVAFTWLHLMKQDARTGPLLRDLGLEPIVVEALLAEETRPRCTVHGHGAVLILRGVNLNPGAEPEDMVSVRLWIEEKRVVGVWLRRLRAVDDMIAAIGAGQAPVSPSDLVARLALKLADRAEPVIAALNERTDALEEQEMTGDREIAMRPELADIRRMAIQLRRYMFPQRDALTTLEIEDLGWLEPRDRSRFREAAERVMRLGEELDAVRDRAQIIHDQALEVRAEDMNRKMLVLAVVAAIFLPLGLLTGLLGINVGGIPGTEQPWAFAAVCGLTAVIAAAEIWFFRRIGLFRR